MKQRERLARSLSVIGAIAVLLFVALSRATSAAGAATSWQTFAGQDVLPSGATATLGLRNKYGSDGECYQFTVRVYNPYLQPAGQLSDWVCGSDWTYESYLGASIAGTYTVSFGIDGTVVARDQFTVQDS